MLEHVENDIKALSEMKRVLRPGGWAILQVPFFYPLPKTTQEDSSIINPKEREKAFGQDDHVRMYGEDYAERIKSTGFEVAEEDFISELDTIDIERNALPAKEIIFKAIKSTS